MSSPNIVPRLEIGALTQQQGAHIREHIEAIVQAFADDEHSIVVPMTQCEMLVDCARIGIAMLLMNTENAAKDIGTREHNVAQMKVLADAHLSIVLGRMQHAEPDSDLRRYLALAMYESIEAVATNLNALNARQGGEA